MHESKSFTGRVSKSDLHGTTIQPWIRQRGDRQDNYNSIHDLNDYLRKNHKSNKFLGQIPKFKSINFDDEKLKSNDDNILFLGVFDGHNGSFASQFVCQVLPYELFISPLYQAKQYRQALIEAFHNTQESLMNCLSYGYEGKFHHASGTTASISLVTPTKTYFASVGDSPIVVCMKENQLQHIGACHTRHNNECMKNIIESNIPVFVTEHSETENYLTTGGNLQLLGSLGDILYDEQLFNALIDLSRQFRVAKSSRLSQYKSVGNMTAKFGEFVEQCRHPLAKLILRCINFKLELSLIVDLIESARLAKITKDPIIRTPVITSIVNSEVNGFMLATNGVIPCNLKGVLEPSLHLLLFNRKSGFD